MACITTTKSGFIPEPAKPARKTPSLTISSKMPIRALLAVAFYALFAGWYAAADTVQVPFAMKKGDVFILQVETTRKDARAQGTHEGSSIERERIEVLDTTPSGYVVNWSISTVERWSNENERLTALKAIDDALARESLTFELDRNGRPLRARDWRSMLGRVETSVRAEFATGATERQRLVLDATFAALLSMGDSEASLKLGETLRLWSTWHAQSLSIDQPAVTPHDEPNPFPGEPVDMERQILSRVEHGVLSVEVTDRLKPAGSSSLLDAYFGLTPNLQKHRAQIEARYDMTPDLRFERRFDIDMRSGWTTGVMQKRVLAYGELSQSTLSKTIRLLRE